MRNLARERLWVKKPCGWEKARRMSVKPQKAKGWIKTMIHENKTCNSNQDTGRVPIHHLPGHDLIMTTIYVV
jgi:hypothetical protein